MNSRDYRAKARELFKTNGYAIPIITTLLVYAVIAVTSVVSFFILGPALVGLAYFFLQSFRNEKSVLEDVVKPLTTNYITTFLAIIVKGIFIFLWSLLFVIPGIIKAYSYAMVEYILADDNDITTMDAIERSKQMMYGHKWRLFKLQLSFIGWIILSFFTFGILLIYVIPYMQAAIAAFYLDIAGENYSDNEIKLLEDQYRLL